MAEQKTHRYLITAERRTGPAAFLSRTFELVRKLGIGADSRPGRLAGAIGVRSFDVEVFPPPDDPDQGTFWTTGPATAFIEGPEAELIAARPVPIGPNGERFKLLQVERLAEIADPKLKVIHEATDEKPFDLLFLSEGYADADENQYLRDAERLSTEFLKIEPYRSLSGAVRISSLFLPSPESGITEARCDGKDHSGQPCPAAAGKRETLFGTKNLQDEICRLIHGSEVAVRKALSAERIRRALEKTGITPRLAAVIVNTKLYGGAGARELEKDPLVVWSAPAMGGAVLSHEVGHALGLQDEYEREGTALPDPDKWVNISDKPNPADTNWSRYATDKAEPHPTCRHGQACDVPSGTIGTFEGAGYRKEGRYRPMKDCGMRSTGAPYCFICQLHIRQELTGTAQRTRPRHSNG